MARDQSAATTALRWRSRHWIMPVVQSAVTIGLLYWLLADPAMLANMRQTLARADPLWLAAGVSLGGAWVAVAAYRWRVFLAVQQIHITYRRTAAVCVISMFFSLFLPGAISGDAVRIFYLFRERPDRKHGVVLSVIMDHLAGMVALMALAGALTFSRWSWFTTSMFTTGTLYFLLGFCVLSVVGVAATLIGFQTGLVHTMPRRTPGRAKLIEFADACSLFLREWRRSLRGVAVSFVVLPCYFLTFYCAARAFDADVTLLDIFSIMPIIDVAAALPVTVAGLGVRETLFQEMLGRLAGVPADVAVLISLTGFAFSSVWSLVGGVVFPLYRSSRRARSVA